MNIYSLKESWSNSDAETAFVEVTRKAVFNGLRESGNSTNGTAMWFEWVRAAQDRCRTTKQKGDLFERLCKHYMQAVQHMPECWLLYELPEAIRQELGLRRNDFGIDLICRDAHGAYHAVQAKFRVNGGSRRCFLPWRELSTFDALCQRSGPYAKHWVLTSADGVRRIGRRTEKDRSVCAQSWRNLDSAFWHDCAQLHGQRLDQSGTQEQLDLEPLDLASLRARRLAHFEK